MSSVNTDTYSTGVAISATSLLPSGAKLSAAKKKSKGKWMATMTWTPTAGQAGESFPVTFTAQDSAAGSTSVTFDTTFTVSN